MIKLIKKVEDVTKATIQDVKTLRSDVADANANPLVEELITSVSDVNSADREALRTAIESVVEEKAAVLVPSGRRIPDRSLVQGAGADRKGTGGRATDGDIAAGKFVIVPPSDFSLVLDMEPTDIILRES